MQILEKLKPYAWLTLVLFLLGSAVLELHSKKVNFVSDGSVESLGAVPFYYIVIKVNIKAQCFNLSFFKNCFYIGVLKIHENTELKDNFCAFYCEDLS